MWERNHKKNMKNNHGSNIMNLHHKTLGGGGVLLSFHVSPSYSGNITPAINNRPQTGVQKYDSEVKLMTMFIKQKDKKYSIKINSSNTYFRLQILVQGISSTL